MKENINKTLGGEISTKFTKEAISNNKDKSYKALSKCSTLLHC